MRPCILAVCSVVDAKLSSPSNLDRASSSNFEASDPSSTIVDTSTSSVTAAVASALHYVIPERVNSTSHTEVGGQEVVRQKRSYWIVVEWYPSSTGMGEVEQDWEDDDVGGENNMRPEKVEYEVSLFSFVRVH